MHVELRSAEILYMTHPKHARRTFPRGHRAEVEKRLTLAGMLEGGRLTPMGLIWQGVLLDDDRARDGKDGPRR